jgi:uncharacterized protein YfiM (DUF2279 family)
LSVRAFDIKRSKCNLWQISRTKRDVASIRAKLLAISLFVSFFGFSQSKINTFLTPSDSLHPVRKKTVYIAEASVIGAGLIGLNQLWYADYPQSKFHFYNDNSEWMQMDKVGHFYSTYHVGRFGAELLAWSGASKKEQLCYGATLGLGFLTVVEVFDGFSQEWGFSWGDMTANAAGTGLYIGQELLWNEQRIIPKFSFHQTHYAQARPEALGAYLNEQILKDYNGQTYWLSVNLHSFVKRKYVPKWLNVAVGYGADGMFYGNQKEALANEFYQNPTRQLYLSLDVDLTKINTKSHLLKTVFSVFNTVKIPAPTLEIGAFRGVKGHFIYF